MQANEMIVVVFAACFRGARGRRGGSWKSLSVHQVSWL